MKNVTISMDDELYRLTRIEAAKAGKSMSKHIADRLRQESSLMQEKGKAEERNRRLKALQHVFEGPMWDVTENGRMPDAEERNARR